MADNFTALFITLLNHTKMLIQRLQKWWIFTRMRSVWIFKSTIFEVIGLAQFKIAHKKYLIHNTIYTQIAAV